MGDSSETNFLDHKIINISKIFHNFGEIGGGSGWLYSFLMKASLSQAIKLLFLSLDSVIQIVCLRISMFNVIF